VTIELKYFSETCEDKKYGPGIDNQVPKLKICESTKTMVHKGGLDSKLLICTGYTVAPSKEKGPWQMGALNLQMIKTSMLKSI
jgi:hypothetical protein